MRSLNLQFPSAFVGVTLVLSLFLSACNREQSLVNQPVDPIPDSTSNTGSSLFFQYSVNSLDGVPVNLEQFKGKKIVVLNVASHCGYTPQYGDWETFYEAHKDNIVVLGFPCNDFGGQEPGDSKEISAFCTANYGITFPMFEKVHVLGANKSPVYKWLTDPALNGWNSKEPSWNFCKYLLNEKGELTHFFASGVTPGSPEFLQAIQ